MNECPGCELEQCQLNEIKTGFGGAEMKRMRMGLSAEEINYILSFMDKSADYCTSEDDYKFDEELKKKLIKMIK